MVSSLGEASIVAHAVFEIGLTVMQMRTKKTDEEMIRKVWQLFVESVQQDKWRYLREMAALYRG